MADPIDMVEMVNSGNMLLTWLPENLADGIISEIETSDGATAQLIRQHLTENVRVTHQLSHLVSSGRVLLTKLPSSLSDGILQDIETCDNPIGKLIRKSLSMPSTIADDLAELVKISSYLLTALPRDDMRDLVGDVQSGVTATARLLRQCLSQASMLTARKHSDGIEDQLDEILTTGQCVLLRLPQALSDEILCDLEAGDSIAAEEIRRFMSSQIDLDIQKATDFGPEFNAPDATSSTSASARDMVDSLVDDVMQNASRDACGLLSSDQPIILPIVSSSNGDSLGSPGMPSPSPSARNLLDHIVEGMIIDSAEVASALDIPDDDCSDQAAVENNPLAATEIVLENEAQERAVTQRSESNDVGLEGEQSCDSSRSEHEESHEEEEVYSDDDDEMPSMPDDEALETDKEHESIGNVSDVENVNDNEIVDSDSGFKQALAAIDSDEPEASEDYDNDDFIQDEMPTTSQQDQDENLDYDLDEFVQDELPPNTQNPVFETESDPVSKDSLKSENSEPSPASSNFETDTEPLCPENKEEIVTAHSRITTLETMFMADLSEFELEKSSADTNANDVTEIENIPLEHQFAQYENGDSYDGTVKDEIREGRGKYTWSCGDTYDGEWRNGSKHGKGTYVWAKGGLFHGMWEEGKQCGRGRFEWQGGMFYEGIWENRPKASMPIVRTGSPFEMWSDSCVKEDPNREKVNPYRQPFQSKELSFETKSRPRNASAHGAVLPPVKPSGNKSDDFGTLDSNPAEVGLVEPKACSTDGCDHIFRVLAKQFSGEREVTAISRKLIGNNVFATRAAGEPFYKGGSEGGLISEESSPKKSKIEKLYAQVFKGGPAVFGSRDGLVSSDGSNQAAMDFWTTKYDPRPSTQGFPMDRKSQHFESISLPSTGSKTLPSFRNRSGEESAVNRSTLPLMPDHRDKLSKPMSAYKTVAHRLTNLVEDHELQRLTLRNEPSELAVHFASMASLCRMDLSKWLEYLGQLEVLPHPNDQKDAGLMTKSEAVQIFNDSLFALRRKKTAEDAQMTFREFQLAVCRVESMVSKRILTGLQPTVDKSRKIEISREKSEFDDRQLPTRLPRKGLLPSDFSSNSGWGMKIVAHIRKNNLHFSDPFRDPLREYARPTL